MYLVSVIRISFFPSVESILAGSLAIGNAFCAALAPGPGRTGRGLRLWIVKFGDNLWSETLFLSVSDRPAALARPIVAVRCVLKSTNYKLIPLASADVWPFCTVLFSTCFPIHRCKINALASRFSRFTLLEPAARVNWKSRARSLLLARAKYCQDAFPQVLTVLAYYV